jgi:chromosome segregation ATPase
MANEPDNLILEHLRRFDRRLNDFDTKLDRMLDNLHTLKVRMTGVEENLVGVQRRIDKLGDGTERIERRLELADAPH